MKDHSNYYDDQLSFAKAGGKACGASYISASYICRIGGVPQIYEVLDTDPAGSAWNEQQLAVMEYQYEKALKNGNHLEFPFKMPVAYDDASGTPEAVKEIADLRPGLKQNTKTGEITVPKDLEISPKARQLIDEWNGLERNSDGRILVYADSKQGTELNVGGLGARGGPRDAVPKDAVRGLVQYAALRRQDAQMADTPTGQRIVSYRDPFTGTPRQFMNENGKIIASQDHWNRPFSIYGVKSENDVKNTVYITPNQNSGKGAKSPVRYVHDELTRTGVLSGKELSNEKVIEGFSAPRYGKGGKDFLPSPQTRASEATEFKANSNRMVEYSRGQVREKYMPKMQAALDKGGLTEDRASKLLYDVAKQKADSNYFGKIERTAARKVWTPYEQKLFKGIGINRVDDNPAKKADVIAKIKANMRGTGQDPAGIIAMTLAAREANTD